MYRSSEDYVVIVKKIIDVYVDYGIHKFPLDEKEMCYMLGIKLLPYSEFFDDTSNISNDSFYIPPTKNNPPLILYNDKIENINRQRFSIFHELKHYICGDTEETVRDEDMANFFARYCMCPIPVLIVRGVDDVATIMADYGLGLQSAYNALNNVRNRRSKYGNKIEEYEKPLIELFERGGQFEGKK